MVAPGFSCNHQQLRQLLDDTLSSEQQTQVEGHLECCRGCREQLESMAASGEIWREAAEVLTTETAELKSQPLAVQTAPCLHFSNCLPV